MLHFSTYTSLSLKGCKWFMMWYIVLNFYFESDSIMLAIPCITCAYCDTCLSNIGLSSEMFA